MISSRLLGSDSLDNPSRLVCVGSQVDQFRCFSSAAKLTYLDLSAPVDKLTHPHQLALVIKSTCLDISAPASKSTSLDFSAPTANSTRLDFTTLTLDYSAVEAK